MLAAGASHAAGAAGVRKCRSHRTTFGRGVPSDPTADATQDTIAIAFATTICPTSAPCHLLSIPWLHELVSAELRPDTLRD